MAEEAILKRVLPHSIEAEQSVIGSMIMDKDAIVTASEILHGDDFYSKQYGIIFDAMVELHDSAQPVDLITLQNKLKEKDVPPEVSSLEFVKDLLGIVPTSANVANYANIVAEKSLLRKLIRLNEEIENTCYAGKESLEFILEDTEKRVFDLVQRRNTGDFVPIRQVVLNAMDKIEQASKTTGTVTGIATGFIDLDYKTSGMQPSDLVLIAARPSMGKTAFVLNIAQHVAFKLKETVAIFSLEMTKEQLTNRILSAEAGIDSQAFRTGALRAEDWEYLALATEKLHDAPIYMDDTSGITITEMKAKIRRVNQDPARPNVGLIVIDYLQLMTTGQRSENRVQEISSITRNLKIMAKEMNVPIIALSQLSRAVEKQGNNSSHRPQLSDLRDSGSIEQDADCVLFLYRDSYYASQNPDGAEVDADTAECIVAKNRHGETSTVPLGWDGAHTRFMDVDFKR